MGKPSTASQEDKKSAPSFEVLSIGCNSQGNTGTSSGRVSGTPSGKVMAQPTQERLEDVFQDDIIKRFSTKDFKKFARSQYGLCLGEYDVSNIVDDYGNQAEEMKLKMLSLWRQRQGDNATPDRIRKVADTFNAKQDMQ